jgi:hypothetical protein
VAISTLAKSSIGTFDKFNKASAGTTIPTRQFLATGTSNIIHTSPDGINWTARTVGSGYAMYAPHRIGNNYYAFDFGYKNRYVSTDNGVTWTKSGQMIGAPQTSSPAYVANAKLDPIDNTTNFFPNKVGITGNFGSMVDITNAVALGDLSVTNQSWSAWDYATNGSVFLIAGGSGATAPYLLKSTTTKLGTYAAQAYGASTDSYAVCWGNNTFAVAAGDGTGIYTSPTGVTWTSRGQSNRYLQFLNTLFFNYNGNLISRSSDAINWTSTTVTGLGGDGIFQMAYGAGVYVMVCGSGKIFTSTDGAAWTSRTSGTGTGFTHVYYG